MKRHLLLFFLFSVLTGQLMAQVKVRGNQSYFRVTVQDAVTKKDIVEGTMVELLSKDSVLIMAAAPVQDIFARNNYFTALKPPSRTGEYIIRVTHERYETMTRRITLKNGLPQESATFELKRKPKEGMLGTAVVRATKIKFYHKGDTLVYNADAFNLAEGSMLDALIEQLPGVELKRDGRIFVQGKQVESLLLNGKAFFNGKNSIMLENLPSYMVKHVKVYEKQSEFSGMTGIKDSDPALVMDVRLKREYSIGWTANAQVGGGTEDRWLGRLFALRFTPQSRLSAFANANNTNETRKPGNNGDWWPGDITGQTTVKTGGFDYLISDKNHHYEVGGNVEASHTDGKSETHQTVENFMPGGSNTFARRWFAGKNENTSVSTSHSLRLRFLNEEKKELLAQLRISPNFSYSKYDNWSHNLSGEFCLDPSEYVGLRDSMGSPEIGARLTQLLVNRVRSEQLSHGYSVGGGGTIEFSGKRGYTIGGGVTASRQSNESHDLYRLDYTTGAASDHRRRYYDRPVNSLRANLTLSKWWDLSGDGVWMLSPILSYSYSHNSQDNALYRLDALKDMADEPLGALPSTHEALLSTLDEVNSYLQTQDNHTVTLNLGGRWDVDVLDSVTYQRDEKKRFSWSPRLIIQREQLAFEGQVHKRPQRTAVLPYLNLGFTRVTPGNKHEIDVNATFSQSLPSLSYGLGIRLDSDPLNVRDWDIDLSRTNVYSLDIRYWARSWLKSGQMLNARAQFSAYQNSVATGYTYDSQTGVRTYSPENVNGNWYASLSGSFATPLDKEKRLMLTFSPGHTVNHSVDLVALDGAARTSRSVVLTNTLHMPLKLDYSRNKWRVGFSFDSWWNRATSHRPGFVTVNGADMSAGLSAKAQLPWNMELATDFSYIWRYGYSDESMNTRDLVWNAQLSKSILKGNLTFTLIGFDILGQLSQVSYSLNAQGRTEQWRNVIPSYGMLRITYRLSKQPKQR